ncbi:MAG: phage protein [Parashewanella sp.]
MSLSGMNFDVNMGALLVHVDTASLSITDNSSTAQTGGVPDGTVDGDVSANGEMVVKTRVFKQILAEAKKAGSWRGMKTFDIMFYAKKGNEEIKIEAFGCRIELSDLLDLDAKGGSATTFKIPYEVTSPDFVHIDGVPYLRPEEIEHIVQ